MRWLIIIVGVSIGGVVGFFVALSPLVESENMLTLLIILVSAMGVCACVAVLVLRSANKLIAYLGVVACVILGGILGVFASVLLLSAVHADIDNIHMLIGIALGAFIGGALAVIRVQRYMRERSEKALAKHLPYIPENAANLIRAIIGQMRYRKEVRAEVMAELAAHFEDELKDCKTDEEKEQKAKELIGDFGDIKLLAVLLRRAKKRCRPLWRTMVARTFQTVGILILLLIVYIARFLSGRPVISVDYLAQLNQLVRPTADESLNAAPLYTKAARLYGKCSDDFLLFFAENYEEISDPEVGGRFRRGGSRLRAEELADDIRRLFSKREEADFVKKRRRDIKPEVAGRVMMLLRKAYGETSLAERKFIKKWIEEQKEALDLVVAGSQKPYYWQKYGNKQNTSEMMSILLPDLAKFKSLAYSLLWRARLRAEEGRHQAAFSDIKSCYRLGQHTKGNNTLVIEQLVGIAIESLAAQTLLEILSEYEIDNIVLGKLQKEFEQILAKEDFSMSFQAERLSIYDAIQRCFTEDRFAGGHLYLQEFKRLRCLVAGDDSYSFLEDIIEERAWTAPLRVLFTHPNKQQTSEMAERLYDFWNQMAHKTPASTHSEAIDLERQSSEIIKGNILLEILAPAFDRIIELSYHKETEVRALITIVALLRYKNDKGVYPENLMELVTVGYISELPMDPWSDRPLVYKKTDDDFTLYSVGENFKDDGGEVIRDYDGRVRTWAREGDAVFWPVPKPETPEEREKRLEEARNIKKSRLWRRSK